MKIKNCRLFDGKEFHRGGRDICIDNGVIKDIVPTDDEKCSGPDVDAQGLTAVPGYVDIHTHGAGGFDNANIIEESLDKMILVYSP